MTKRQDTLSVRSSAAEVLTFAASAAASGVELLYKDEDLWISQRMLSVLYDVSVPTIREHMRNIYADGELSERATIRNFLIVQNEGGRSVSREVKHYNLSMIISVGFKVNSERAVQFRRWVNDVAREFTIKGWVMDLPRLKDGTYLSDKYFEEQLERVREIRASERRFYQKVTDIYATAVDYDADAQATKRFYASVQNKLHFAVHGHTAAELIFERADASREHMGLTTWRDAPNGKILKSDVVVAKNYLSEAEMSELNRLVSAYLDFAESMAKRHIPLTMADWESRLNGFISMFEYGVLKDAGRVSAEIAKLHAEVEFEKFRVIQDKTYMSDFDRYVKRLEEEAAEYERDGHRPGPET